MEVFSDTFDKLFRHNHSRKLSLRLRETTLTFNDVKKVESNAKPKKKDVNVLLPCWALAYFPIMFLAGALFSIGDPFGKFYVFVFSGMSRGGFYAIRIRRNRDRSLIRSDKPLT